MIFVTVGQHPEGFDRLVRVADEMAALVEEPVVIQRGGTRYAPKFAQYFDFVTEAEVQEWLSRARVVISHGGAGSILSVLQMNKPLIVVPRLRHFGEVIDDHQSELAEALSRQGKVIVVTTLSSGALQQAVEQIGSVVPTSGARSSGDSGLQSALRAWLVGQSKLVDRKRRML